MHLPAPNDVRRLLRPCAAASLATSRDLAALHGTDDRPSRHGARPEAAAAGALLQMTAGMRGAERAIEEHNALIYAGGANERIPAQVFRLNGFLDRRGWRLAGLHVDVLEPTNSSERPGLVDALAQLRSGAATVLVLNESTYASTPDRLWLRVAVQRAGVELHVVADRDVDTNETVSPDLGSSDSFLEIARCLASCGRGAG